MNLTHGDNILQSGIIINLLKIYVIYNHIDIYIYNAYTIYNSNMIRYITKTLYVNKYALLNPL